MTLTRFQWVLFLIAAAALPLQAAAPAGAPYAIARYAGTGQPGYSGDAGPAGQAGLNNPYGLTIGPDGALYVCDMDNHAIRRVSRDGVISTVAGTGKRGYSGDGGPAAKAELNEPYEIRFDPAGNMFFVEMKNHLVRRVNAADGIISTVAGTGKEGFSGDGGPARLAAFRQPHSIQFDSQGDLYICDIGNQRIRKIEMKSGTIHTFAGNGGKGPINDGAALGTVSLNGPRAIDFDRKGNLWLALREGNAIYEIDMAGKTIHHRAGTGQKGFTGNGGPAKSALLSGPKGLSVGPDGNVYLADTESHSIRMIDVKSGQIELIAGTGERGSGPDGSARQCALSRPHGVFVDREGVVWIGDSESHVIRRARGP